MLPRNRFGRIEVLGRFIFVALFIAVGTHAAQPRSELFVVDAFAIEDLTDVLLIDFAETTGAPRPSRIGSDARSVIARFCMGVGPGTPDVVLSDRAINQSEQRQCADNNVTFKAVATPPNQTFGTFKSSPVYIYYKVAHLGVIPGLDAFLQRLEGVVGEARGGSGPLAKVDFVPGPSQGPRPSLAQNPGSSTNQKAPQPAVNTRSPASPLPGRSRPLGNPLPGSAKAAGRDTGLSRSVAENWRVRIEDAWLSANGCRIHLRVDYSEGRPPKGLVRDGAIDQRKGKTGWNLSVAASSGDVEIAEALLPIIWTPIRSGMFYSNVSATEKTEASVYDEEFVADLCAAGQSPSTFEVTPPLRKLKVVIEVDGKRRSAKSSVSRLPKGEVCVRNPDQVSASILDTQWPRTVISLDNDPKTEATTFLRFNQKQRAFEMPVIDFRRRNKKFYAHNILVTTENPRSGRAGKSCTRGNPWGVLGEGAPFPVDTRLVVKQTVYGELDGPEFKGRSPRGVLDRTVPDLDFDGIAYTFTAIGDLAGKDSEMKNGCLGWEGLPTTERLGLPPARVPLKRDAIEVLENALNEVDPLWHEEALRRFERVRRAFGVPTNPSFTRRMGGYLCWADPKK